MKYTHTIVGIVLYFIALNTHAALVDLLERDWKTDGDSLITYDMTTGLEWLDLTQTTGYSYNEMAVFLSDTDNELYGFRHATKQDILGLVATADITIINDSLMSLHEPVLALQTFVSINWSEIDRTSGITGSEVVDGPSFPTCSMFGGCHYYFMLNSSSGFGQVIENAGALRDYIVDVNAGHWLIRNATVVPIPPALWLFASGLIGLVGVARRGTA